ncbi:MAG: GNAT family N-acetyltransferase [Actinomycetales bacterium]|nr:GNAT family N-acetyltransferase [Actinomycetales bacterium]
MDLRAPSLELLDGYLDAVRRGWMGDRVLFGSAENLLAMADRDRGAVLSRLADRSRSGIRFLADGTTASALPAIFRWMWDGEFAGSIDLRWPAPGEALPEDVPGHIGFGTVEWRRGRGYATRALALMLHLAREQGLSEVLIVTDVDNDASQRVVERNGGVRGKSVTLPQRIGGGRAYRWRIPLG